LGLPTILGLARRGFFIPYRYAGGVPRAGSSSPYAAIESLFSDRRQQFGTWIETINGFAGNLEAIGRDAPPAPRWRQDWFPRIDAAAAYAVVRTVAPTRIVEVGSGHSTRFLARAVRDGGLATAITAIDPAPRADLAGLPEVKLLQETLQSVGTDPFADLVAGDILAIDSSHILMPGSDVDILLNRILPTLPHGTLLHVHDIFLPDDYPADWAWRGYNEQLGIAALLTSGAWRAEFSSHYAATRMGDLVGRTVLGRLPLQDGARESGLWLKKG
jgi:hypothetical protein